MEGANVEAQESIDKLQGQLDKAAKTETKLRKKKGKYAAYGKTGLTEEEYKQLLIDKSM